MFQDVVIPLDGSESAAVALPVGISLASTADARARVIGIAPTDAELAWTYQHVHDDAKHAGLQDTDVEVRVDPKPVEVLLEIGNDAGTVLCLASRYDPAPVATLLHSVGSQVIERIQQPVVLVGQNAIVETGGSAVVVALDGRNDGGSLLYVAAAWARRLGAPLRIVTVYESIPPDVRETMHFTRAFGPQGDPDEYLASMRERVDDLGLDDVETVSIAHDFGAGRGLEEHLRDCRARLLVVGRHRSRFPRKPSGGVARHLLATVMCPLLVVEHDGDRKPGGEQ
jgi:nucleotide-binding universal stress UspA family protein